MATSSKNHLHRPSEGLIRAGAGLENAHVLVFTLKPVNQYVSAFKSRKSMQFGTNVHPGVIVNLLILSI